MASPSNEYEGIEYSKVNKDVLRSLTKTTWKYYLALGISGLIVVYGTLVYYYQTTQGLGVWGTNEPIFWGIDIANFIFWIGFSLSGTLLSAILLLTNSDWRNPIYRAAEAMTFFALLTAMVVLVTHLGRPWRFWYSMPYPNFRQLWINFRSPLTADMIGMIAYTTGSVFFLFVGSIPDFAALRDQTTGWRKKLYSLLSLGWRGTAREWLHLHRAYILIAVSIVPIAVSMHSVTAWMPNLTLNPGVHSSIFPPYFVTGALLSGSAGIIIILIILRRALHFEDYIGPRHLDHLAKFLLVASLLISYIYIIEVFIPWYKSGLSNFELMPLLSKLKGSYAPMYWAMIILNSLIPLTLFSRKVRRNIPALFLIAFGVEIAMFFERYLMVIPGLNIAQLPATWASYRPTWVEFSLYMWAWGFFAFMYLLFVKIVPSVSIFEVKMILPVPRRLKPVSTTHSAPNLGGNLLDKKTTKLPEGKGKKKAILGLFPYVDDTEKVIEELKEAGFREMECLSPIPSEEIEEALVEEEKISFSLSLNFLKALFAKFIKKRDFQVARFTALGVIGTTLGVLLLAGGTAILYPIQTGGMPIIALPPVGLAAAISGVLGGLIMTALGFIFLAKLPNFKLGVYSGKASEDKFCIVLRDSEERLVLGTEIMEKCGAENIEMSP